ncbi:MAG: PKD domain-containing protein [Acidobacteria bacterium]|nr:PKD domain-containing protein [Acidobacteriota bacterium]
MSNPRHAFGTRLVANPILGVVLIVSGLSVLGTPSAAAAGQGADLRIVVLEGEDSVNIIGQGTAVPTVVEVRDRNDLPVSGASVLFLLVEGGTATLNAGLSQVAVTTNVLGQAAVTVNPLASGAVQLQVSAAFQGQTATAAIVQTNVATATAAGGAAGGAAGTTGAGGGTGGGAGGATGAAAGGAGGGLGTGGIVGVVAGSVGAAVAGAAVAREADPAPPVAVLRVTPNGVGMAGLTEYRFDGSGSSDPNDDTLTYAWDFGDGSRGSGVTATHVYRAPGTYEVALTVSDGVERVTRRGSVEVGPDLRGRFVGHWQFANSDCLLDLTEIFDLRQAAASIDGTYTYVATPRTSSDRCGPHEFYFSVNGSIDSAGDFVCPCDIRLDWRLTGYSNGPPDGDWVRDLRGVVSAAARSIDFGFVIVHRQ